MSKKNNKQYSEPETVVENQLPLEAEMQSETLYDIAQNVAKDVLHIRKEDKIQTQKILVIGQAMISQKDVLASIVETQENINDTVSSDFKDIIQTQDGITTKLDTVSENLKPMQEVCNVQKEIAQSLQELKVQHSQFVNDCDSIKAQQVQYISELQEQLFMLHSVINDASIAESFVSLDGMLKSVAYTFELYQNARTQQREMLAQHMAVTTTALNQFQTDIETQNEIVKRIEKQANMNCNATIVINEKLDQILAQCESKADTQLPTLEEAFAVKTPQESEQLEEVLPEPTVKKSMMKRLFGGK